MTTNSTNTIKNSDTNDFTIENREELIYLLSQAAEIEHTLLCSYLFASFSLKNDVSEDLTEEEVEATTRWKRSIRKIAEQEMLHLTLVNNLLTAIGAAPHFSRPNLPQSSAYFAADVQIALTPFSKQTLDHFIYIERPQSVQLKDGIGFRERQLTNMNEVELPEEAGDAIVPVEQKFSTIDRLYEQIGEGLEQLVEKYGEEKIFIGPDSAQTSAKYFRFPGLTTVTDLASAKEAIELIVSQGEGSKEDYEESHYGIFSKIKEEYDHLKAQRAEFEPARPVLANPYARLTTDVTRYNLFDEPLAVQVSNLFNACYEVMTQMLIRFFAHVEETREELTVLVKTAVEMMKSVIKPLGELLTKLPAGPAFPQNTVGPNFQYYRSIHLFPHKKAAWLIFEERLVEIAGYCDQITPESTSSEVLKNTGANLKAMADLFKQRIESFNPKS